MKLKDKSTTYEPNRSPNLTLLVTKLTYYIACSNAKLTLT